MNPVETEKLLPLSADIIYKVHTRAQSHFSDENHTGLITLSEQTPAASSWMPVLPTHFLALLSPPHPPIPITHKYPTVGTM